VHVNGASGEYYYPEILGPGVGFLDVDNDGDLDVYLVQGATIGPGKKEGRPLGGRLFRNDLEGKGHFAFLCNHGMGHTVPLDILPSMWTFFQDHRYKTSPSPYAGGFPDGFSTYCAL